MQENDFDALIIGAGAAGLMAALELALTGKSVGVIEAGTRVGGRINTTVEHGFPFSLGAEFVHGKLPLTFQLLEKAGVEPYPVTGSIWQCKDGNLEEQADFLEDQKVLEKKLSDLKEDIPVADFLSKHLTGDENEELRFSLTNYVQGYYAADLCKASTFALRQELAKAGEEQYRIEGGYLPLLDYLEGRCRKKEVRFFFEQTVSELRWSRGQGQAFTNTHHFSGRKVLVTVSIGVLQAGTIAFSPALPQKMAAVQSLGFGHVHKIILRFTEAFWADKNFTQGKDLRNLGFLFSGEEVPTWWTQHPKREPVLTGWLGGPPARELGEADEEALLQKAMLSLSRIFGLEENRLRQGLVAHFFNWLSHPHFNGAYSYEVVGGEALMETVSEPVESTVYFAGEGLQHGPQIGTVEAALATGRAAAHRMIAEGSW